MSNDLRERLADIADRSGGAPPPLDLWQRGVRRRRRTRVVQALAAAVVVGVVALVLPPPATTPDRPAPVDSRPRGPAIPDRLVTPPTRLDGTGGDPLGPLAVVAGAGRASGFLGTDTSNGWVGVSAATGEYRFLDLPSRVDPDGEVPFLDDEVVLSPDGRSVAYWLDHPDDPGWVGGWAAYDTVTGDAVGHRVRSDLGLVPGLLTWSKDDELVVGYGVVTERDGNGWSSTSAPLTVWDVRSPDDPRELPRSFIDASWIVPTRAGFAGLVDGDVVRWSRGRTQPDYQQPVTGQGEDASEGTISPAGDRLVMVEQLGTGMAERLLVGEIGPAGTTLEPLPLDVEVFDVAGWADDEHVVVRGVLGGSAAILSVDVRTGEHRLLVREERENWTGRPQYATDLWSRPTVSRPEPAAPPPWWLYGAGAAVLGLGVLGARRWRRARA
jgi:hypothetical protein